VLSRAISEGTNEDAEEELEPQGKRSLGSVVEGTQEDMLRFCHKLKRQLPRITRRTTERTVIVTAMLTISI
jgi:hypothetical protein